MNHGALIFLGVFFTFASSWCGLILAPQLQFGRQQPARLETAVYPSAKTGLAHQGAEVYRAEGCAVCHSQQPRQTGFEIEYWFTKAGTNLDETVTAIVAVDPVHGRAAAKKIAQTPPYPLLTKTTKGDADRANKILEAAGAKGQMVVLPGGPDIERGWARRQAVAADYLYDQPALLGLRRIGPDLRNIGDRRPIELWHLWHLYAPQNIVEDSRMPAYPHLFELRPAGLRPSPTALRIPGAAAPAHFEIVPKPEAIALAAYLTSLKDGPALFEAPVSRRPEPPEAPKVEQAPRPGGGPGTPKGNPKGAPKGAPKAPAKQ